MLRDWGFIPGPSDEEPNGGIEADVTLTLSDLLGKPIRLIEAWHESVRLI